MGGLGHGEVHRAPEGAHASELSAFERSPDDGRRRRATAEAMETAKNILGDGYEYEKSGTIYKGPGDTMSYDAAGEKWVQKPGRAM